MAAADQCRSQRANEKRPQAFLLKRLSFARNSCSVMMLALVDYLLFKTLKQPLNVASSLREDPVWLTTALWDVVGRQELPPSACSTNKA
jgi:hypothetical protein